MPNKTVDALMEAVSKLHNSVTKCQNDVSWVKTAVIGIYGMFGAMIVAAVGAYLAR